MKKILALVACLSLVASLAIGGSIAYLTDRASEVNTFTIGNVKIGISESFDNNTLTPGVDLTKEARIVNQGDNDAWVWMSIEVEPENMAQYIIPTFNSEGWTKKNDTTYLYNESIENGDETTYGLLKVKLDGRIYADSNGDLYLPQNGVQGDVLCNIDDLKVIVNAYAIQADGIPDVETAYDYYVGQWGENGGGNGGNGEGGDPDTTEVSTTDELIEALEEEDQEIVLNATSNKIAQDINLNNNTITAENRTGSSAEESSILTVTGPMTISGNGEVNNPVDYAITLKVFDDDDNPQLTIKGGSYIAKVSAVNVVQGTLTIEGGFFRDTSEYDGQYLINCIDANYENGTANVVIKGGTFVNWNPADNASEGAGTNFLAEGYKVMSETKENGDIYYTVISE